jgi:hypothetical protein
MLCAQEVSTTWHSVTEPVILTLTRSDGETGTISTIGLKFDAQKQGSSAKSGAKIPFNRDLMLFRESRDSSTPIPASLVKPGR